MNEAELYFFFFLTNKPYLSLLSNTNFEFMQRRKWWFCLWWNSKYELQDFIIFYKNFKNNNILSNKILCVKCKSKRKDWTENQNISIFLKPIMQLRKYPAMVNAWCVGANVADACEHGCPVFAAASSTIHTKLSLKATRVCTNSSADIWKQSSLACTTSIHALRT